MKVSSESSQYKEEDWIEQLFFNFLESFDSPKVPEKVNSFGSSKDANSFFLHSTSIIFQHGFHRQV